MLLLHLQGGSAAARGKAGACRAAVLRAAAASIAEPPLSGRPLPGPHLDFPHVADTSGQAIVRHRATCTATTAAPPDDDDEDPFALGPLPVRPPPSRTTAWRKRSAPPAASTPREQKGRCCQKCQQPTGLVGHSQYKGQIYCPYIPGQIPRAGTSTCGGCREEDGPARVRHFGVCAHALPLCIQVCVYILL